MVRDGDARRGERRGKGDERPSFAPQLRARIRYGTMPKPYHPVESS